MSETIKLEDKDTAHTGQKDLVKTWNPGESQRRIEQNSPDGKWVIRYEHSETLGNGTRVFREMDRSPR